MSPWLIGAICLVVGTFIGANLGALLMGVLAAGALADERRRRPYCDQARCVLGGKGAGLRPQQIVD